MGRNNPVWKLYLVDEELGAHSDLYTELFELSASARNKKVYLKLINDSQCMLKYAHRWISRGLDIDFVCYSECFKNLYKYMKISKYRDFQYRLLLGKIVTKEYLMQWGIAEDKKCTFCEVGTETISHIFYYCEKVREIHNIIYEFCEINNLEYLRSKEDFLFSSIVEPPQCIINFVLLVNSLFIDVNVVQRNLELMSLLHN